MDPLEEIAKKLGQRNTEPPKASDMVEIFKYFLSMDGIFGKTKITQKQRNMLYGYSLMHEKHPTWGLEKASQQLAFLFISQDGESRKQGIELFRGLLSQLRNESVNIETGDRSSGGLDTGKR